MNCALTYLILQFENVMRIWLAALLFILSSTFIKGQDMDSLINAMNMQSLPIVCLTVDTSKLNRDTFTQGSIRIIEPLENGGSSMLCKIRIRGNSVTDFAKKSFAIKLINRHGEDLDTALLNIRKENSWILDAMANDRLRMRNRLCFDFWNEINRLPYMTKYNRRNGTIGHFVEVFINGKYNGLYCLSDKIDRKLLGLKKPVEYGDGIVVRGGLYKGYKWTVSTQTLSEYEEQDVDTISWNGWELKVPEKYPSNEAWMPLMHLHEFCRSDYEYFCQHYKEWFYEDNLVDYLAFAFIFNIYDQPYKNTYLSVVNICDDHRFILTPWDLDGSLGMHWSGYYTYEDKYWSYNTTHYTPYDRFANGKEPFNRLFYNNVENFQTKVINRIKQLFDSTLSDDSISMKINKYASLFEKSGAWKREKERWDGESHLKLQDNIYNEVEYVLQWITGSKNFINKWMTNTSGIRNMSFGNKNRPTYYDISGKTIIKKKPRGVYISIDEGGAIIRKEIK